MFISKKELAELLRETLQLQFFSLNFSQMPQPVATRTQRNGLAFSG